MTISRPLLQLHSRDLDSWLCAVVAEKQQRRQRWCGGGSSLCTRDNNDDHYGGGARFTRARAIYAKSSKKAAAAAITTTVWPLAVWLGWSTTQRRCWPLFIQLCSSTSTKELAALGMHVVLAAALVLVAWTQLNLFARIS